MTIRLHEPGTMRHQEAADRGWRTGHERRDLAVVESAVSRSWLQHERSWHPTSRPAPIHPAHSLHGSTSFFKEIIKERCPKRLDICNGHKRQWKWEMLYRNVHISVATWFFFLDTTRFVTLPKGKLSCRISESVTSSGTPRKCSTRLGLGSSLAYTCNNYCYRKITN